MAIIPGSVPLTGKVAPTDTLDTFATHIDIYGEGGYMTVTDISERNAITTERRKQGMAVYVNSENKLYILEDGITDLDWKEFFLSSGDVYVILAGDITNVEAVDKLTDTIGPKTQFVWIISSNPSLTMVTVPPPTSPATVIGDLVGIEVTSNSVLTDITFEGITEIWKTLDISYNSSLDNVDLSSIITMTSTDATINTNSVLTSIDLSSIVDFAYIDIHTNPLLTTIDFSNIDTIKGIKIDNCNSLISFDLSNLTIATLHPSNFEININSCIILDSIDLSKLVTCDININLSTLPFLSTLNLSSMTSCGSILMTKVDTLTAVNASLLTETIGPGILSTFTVNVDAGAGRSEAGSASGYVTIMVYICNNITDITFISLDSVAKGIGIGNNPNLTSIDFSSLTEIIPDSTGLAGDSGYMGLVIISNDLLTTIDFSLLETIDVGTIYIANNIVLTGSLNFIKMLTCSGSILIKGNNAITSIDFPLLTRALGINIQEEAITNINFSSLIDTWDTTGNTTLGFISISSCDLLTYIDMSSLTTTNNLTISSCDALLNIDFSSLTDVIESQDESISIKYNHLLSSVNLSSLVTVNNLVEIKSNDAITSINLSSLISGTGLTINLLPLLVDIDLSSLVTLTSHLYINNNDLLDVASPGVLLPSLETAYWLNIYTNNLLSIVEAPVLDTVRWVNIHSNPSLTTVLLPLLTNIGEGNQSNPSGSRVTITDNSSLTYIDIFSLVSLDAVGLGNRNIFLDANALTVANVSDILIHFADMSPIMDPCTIKLGGGTNGIPNTAGDTARLFLEGEGWTVVTNS